MKKYTFILAILLLSIAFVSCEKEEVSICSCLTTETSPEGFLISQINSAEESPISGNCLDLNYLIVDQETGISTSKLCN